MNINIECWNEIKATSLFKIFRYEATWLSYDLSVSFNWVVLILYSWICILKQLENAKRKEIKSSDFMKTRSHTDLAFKDKHRISHLQSCLR